MRKIIFLFINFFNLELSKIIVLKLLKQFIFFYFLQIKMLKSKKINILHNKNFIRLSDFILKLTFMLHKI